jgi:predicted NAD/FAD-binding protein
MKIAVVGAGVAGIGSAWLLSPGNLVDVYESEPRLGGHAYTVDLEVDGVGFPADAGFQVFNTRTYPNLIRFFDLLGIEWSETDMSFSVQVGTEHIEWSGTNLNTVFAQRANIVNPKFLSMLAGVLKFSQDADRLLADPSINEITLGELIEREGYSRAFIDWYLLPMGDAIWSTPPGLLLEYPAGTFLRFCDNHGLLHVTGKPMWRSVVGGSRTYIARAVESVSGSVFADEPVERVERSADGVIVVTARRSERYDAVVIATHPPETLSMLAEPSEVERQVLGAFRYQPNGVTLHTDTSFMPANRRAWAAWNWYAETGDATKDMLTLTYWLNDLQEMPDGVRPVFETLNENRPFAEGSTLMPMTFMHPLFTAEAIAAQRRLPEIQGIGGIWYAGAWQRYGFHEDGLLSAVRVAESLGALVPWGDELDASRTRVLSPVAERVARPVPGTVPNPAPESSA